MKTYAAFQARVNNNPAFHRMVLFDHEKFYLLLSKGGDFISATKCDWITPGSRKLLQNFFDVPSPLVKALKACCEALSVTPCPPQVNMPCILGAGGNGVVFRVTRNDANSTTRCDGTPSETAAQECMALKVSVGDWSDASVYLYREWDVTKDAGLLSKRVVTVGGIHCQDRFGGYLMTEVRPRWRHLQSSKGKLCLSSYMVFTFWALLMAMPDMKT